jgi:hypothetical protein
MTRDLTYILQGVITPPMITIITYGMLSVSTYPALLLVVDLLDRQELSSFSQLGV